MSKSFAGKPSRASRTIAPGARVVAALHSEGYRIRALSIDPPQLDQFPRNIEFLIGNVTKAADVESAMKGVVGVIHLAEPDRIEFPVKKSSGRVPTLAHSDFV